MNVKEQICSFTFKSCELLIWNGRFDFFLFLKLAHIKVVIETLFLHQLVMLAAFDDLAIIQNQDHIGVDNGA